MSDRRPDFVLTGRREDCREDLTLSDTVYAACLSDLQHRLRRCQIMLRHSNRRVLVVFEGWDAAGKGGIIKRMLSVLDPRGFKVWPVAAPSLEERRYPYLHRFWMRLPEPGTLTVFDRSWYGRVLIERVEGLIPPDVVDRAFGEITEFERLLTNDGIHLVKFWLEISADVQIERFRARYDDPIKRWKLSEDDFKAYGQREAYAQAIDEMLERTSRVPWKVVPCHQKRYGRCAALNALVEELEALLPDRLPALPPQVEALAKIYFN